MSYNIIRGKIKEKFNTQKAFAKALGISTVSLSSKLNGNTDFNHTEMSKMIELLELKENEISNIFFAHATKKT